MNLILFCDSECRVFLEVIVVSSIKGNCKPDSSCWQVMVDIRNTELYLKVIAQIHAVYRTDGSRMMFGSSSGLTPSFHGAASSATPAAPSGPAPK
jgi:hypothetical protein